MKRFLDGIRVVSHTGTRKRSLLYAVCFLVAGLAIGVASKWLDVNTQNLGNLFSQLSVWILLGTVIAVFSSTPWRAAIYEFLFSAGMLAAYYTAAALWQLDYSPAFIFGWSVFCLFSPVFAWLAWYAGGRGIFAKIIGVGILLVMLLGTVVLFDKVRISDFILIAATAVVLFVRAK